MVGLSLKGKVSQSNPSSFKKLRLMATAAFAHQRKFCPLVTFTVDREWFVAVLKTVAVGAVVYASPIQPLDAFDLRDFVFQARRQQHLSCGG